MSHQIPNLKPLFPIGRCRMTVFDFTNQIDQVYTGLGIPTLYGVLSILANKSVLYVAVTGTGKTRVINLIPTIVGTIEKKMDTFTLSDLDGYVIKNKHLVIKVEDFSSTSKYHRETFLKVFCKIISDGNFNHHTKGPNGMNIDIQNCNLTVLVAIQPRLYSKLCSKLDEWPTMVSDRFNKFILLNPLKIETKDVVYVPTLPRKISKNVRLSLEEVDLSKIVSMYRRQLSQARAFLSARDYVKALAKFLGVDTVQQSHADLFYKLFHPYLDSFSELQRREDLGSPVQVSAGNVSLLSEIGKTSDYVEKKMLAHDLHVEERSIERPAKELLEIGLIEKPSPHAGKYRLSEPLREFFKWYGGLVC